MNLIPKEPSQSRILVIEDSASDAMLLRRALHNAGIPQVDVVRDGLQGLTSLLQDPPDVLVLDLQLPSLPGDEILRMIRSSERLRQLPVVIVSELSDAARREMELLRLGADYYMRKPFDFTELGARVTGLLCGEAPRGRAEPAPPAISVDSPLPTLSLGPVPDAEPAGAAGRALELQSDYNGYELIEMIGYGGMGTVYKARQRSTGMQVALKVLIKTADAQQAVMRFHREGEIMASVSHPNIVSIIEAGEAHRTLYIAMEFIPGGTLLQAAGHTPINAGRFALIADQCCDAIAYLHSKGILHRDLKPSNVLLAPSDLVKITDFGISRSNPLSEQVLELTPNAQVLGTPRYMAPEVGIGQRANEQSDQYSLAKTLLKAICPHLRSPRALDAEGLRPDIPANMVAALAQATAWNPEERFPSVSEFRAALSS